MQKGPGRINEPPFDLKARPSNRAPSLVMKGATDGFRRLGFLHKQNCEFNYDAGGGSGWAADKAHDDGLLKMRDADHRERGIAYGNTMVQFASNKV